MDKHNHHSHHLIPLEVYVKTLLALLVLTVITVGASYIDFGKANIFVALGIASLKASLVMMFFMGLKYDNWLNRATILSSFLALFLFIFYVAADIWTREMPVPVKVVAAGGGFSFDELKAMAVGGPDKISKGKDLYAINCGVCHGADGKGDGVGGQSLKPPPRNFHAPAAEWKFGNSPEAIYGTLALGSPGTGMAAYKQMSPEDRWALSHFVASLGTGEKINKDPARYENALKEDSAGAAGGAGGARKPIPVDFAIERMLQESK